MKHFFQHQVPANLRAEFKSSVYKPLRNALRIICIVMCAFELVMIGNALTYPGPVTSSPNRLTYFTLYVCLFVVSAIMLLLLSSKRFPAHNTTIFFSVYYAYGSFVCLWAGFMSGYAHYNTADVSVFLYTSLAVAMLMPMRPLQSLALFTVNEIFFLCVMHHYLGAGVDAYPSTVNSAITSTLCFMIALILQSNREESFMSRKTILQQSEEIQKMNDNLRSAVLLDELTQIHNRRYLEHELPEILEQLRQEQTSVSLYMIDIDCFKLYNDIYGHQQGDDCLRQVASVLASAITDKNGKLIRYGGEEFLVFVPDLTAQQARELGECMRCSIEQAAIAHSAREGGVVTVSLGLCRSRGDGDATLFQLITYADSALYQAKTSGRNRLAVYAPDQEQPPSIPVQ